MTEAGGKVFVLHTGVRSAQENVHKKPGSEVLLRAHSREESAGRDVVCVWWQNGGRAGPTVGLLELAVPAPSPVSQGSR